MFHFTIFGGSEVTLTGSRQLIFTLFGGTDVRKPTLAKRLMQEKHAPWSAEPAGQVDADDKLHKFKNFFEKLDSGAGGRPGQRSSTFLLTIFGSVELKPPSIAEEFMDMRELVSSGLIEPREWDQLVGRMYQMGDLDSISSFTLFGGMDEAALSEEEEIKKITSATSMGLISGDEEQALRSVVGRDPQQVRMLLRQTAFA